MKKLLILALAWLMPAIVFAGVVTQQQAIAEATSFANGRNLTTNVKLASKADRTRTVDATAYYYVFNFGNNQGFVIVSGDDRTNPILGYSDEGSFDADKIPANMKAWLDGYAEQIKALETMSDTEANRMMAVPRRASIPTHNSIAPMITTKWDQATPYWNECPQFMISDNEEDGYELAYTGCVATAMSQIMNFHKYPEQTTQVIPSYTFTYSDGYGEYGTAQMEELPITTFDWAHMKDSYTGAEDEVYTSAVAHLMLYAGCAVKSQYGVSSTGAYTDDIPKGFALLGYGSKLAYRIDYSLEVWNNMVYEELAAGRPMIYNGTAGSGGGHSFICDGYEYGDYFHINWGWSGMGNGYFQLAILNPSASGIGGSSSAEGYNMKQNIVYNIIPGGTAPVDDPEEPALTATAISGPSASWTRDKLSDPFKIYKSRIVKLSFSDHSGSGKKFKTALALYNPNDSSFTVLPYSEDVAYFTVTTSALGETRKFGDGILANASNVIKFGAGMTGIYRLVGVYQVQNTTEWKMMKESDRYYIEVNMTTYEATGTDHPDINLQVTGWEFTGGERVGVKEQVHATVKNNSVDRYFGDLYLDFGGQQIDESSQYTSVVQVEVMPGEEAVVTFNITPASPGTKTVKLMRVDPTYGDFITIPATGSVTIAQGSSATELNLSVVINAENAVPADNPNDFDVIYDSYAHFSATITNNSNGEYSKYVLAPLFIVKKNPDGSVAGGTMVTYKQSPLSLQAGESKTLYFDFDNLAYGETYSMNIYARNFVPDDQEGTHVENIVQPGHSVYYDIMPGIITWTPEGVRNGYKPVENFQIADDVAAVSLEGIGLNNVVPNANPNAIYYVGEGESAPASLADCNVVTGSTAAGIALKDGYPYFIPQSFTAANVSYERTFNSGRVGGQEGGFSTVVLPFAPTSVKADGTELVRYNSGTDTGKDYWMLYFNEENDGAVKFDYAGQIEANVPYVMAVNSRLIGKPVTMSATNVQLKTDPIAYTSAQNYVMAGTFIDQNLENIYVMNAQGNRFVLNAESQAVEPFRAYFNTLAQVSDQGYIEIVLDETPEEPVETLLGDVNLSGVVDVTDVNILINIILNKDSADNYGTRAYITDDDTIDVSDVNALINIILHKN
ncbi:MAG: C10 family peptidase [Muribaculaceae bacterium]|nr:C10 family peptidase [Muribaculaceae bacterium]